MRILILGGYGVFGGRLARLLADDDRLTLILAGRSAAKAAAFCAGLAARAALEPLALDRDGDMAPALAVAAPDLVVDATGPFQAYGASPYRVVEACLAQGCDYMDLADGADFVSGVSRFDEAARVKGIVVLSGVSTCPVLTACAVSELSADFDNVDSVVAGIGPSPYSGVGLNVVRALTSYAGKPLTVSRKPALIETRRVVIGPPGRRPLKPRLFAVVDTPDSVILPAVFPGLTSVWFGAGPRPEIYLRLLIVLAWLVRLRLLPTVGFLAPLGNWMMNTLIWGEARGGMFVEARGSKAGAPISRTWHLLAEGDDGPFIPSMAAAALVRKWLVEGRPAPGARHAVGDLTLADYQPLFAARQITTDVRRGPRAGDGVYRGLLEDALDALPEPIRTLHEAGDGAVYEGQASVARGANPLAALVAGVTGFPRAGQDVPLRVAFAIRDGVETWTRTFAGKSFSSTQAAGQGPRQHLLIEGFGPGAFSLALVVDGDRLRLVMVGWRLLGLPMPLWLAPRMEAFETVEAGRFRMSVTISHPLTGLIVRYGGWLERVKIPSS